jgi:hypothetical protein
MKGTKTALVLKSAKKTAKKGILRIVSAKMVPAKLAVIAGIAAIKSILINKLFLNAQVGGRVYGFRPARINFEGR